MSSIQTFGEILPGGVIELVRKPDSDNMFLHAREGRRFTTAREFRDGKRILIPAPFSGGLISAIRFPPPSTSFGSAHELIWSMREFFSHRSRLSGQPVCVLVAFAVASWFVDVVDVAPTLDVFGPECEVSRVLRLLGSCCRQSILLGHADLASLGRLPKGIAATMILNQRDLDDRTSQILMASCRRHFGVAHSNGLAGLYGSKVLAGDEASPLRSGLDVSLRPALEPLPPFSDADEEEWASFFQARLLRFRMLCCERVRNTRIDCGSFIPAMRDLAQSWLAPINELDELKASITEELQRRGNELASARFSDLRCVIAEAALNFCHLEGIDHVHVGQVSNAANTLLVGRHERPTLTPRRTGAILRQFGIDSQREARGFRIELNDQLRLRIHQIASAYRVVSLDGTIRCRHCPGAAEGQDSPNL